MNEGTSLSCCLTFDFDAMSAWIGSVGSNSPSALSRGEFEAFALPRILSLLDRHGAIATFFIPGHTALAFPRLVEQVVDAGHEVGHHGWVHENPASCSREEERRNIERGIESLERVGAGTPKGYRSPAWDLSSSTLELLLEYGFVYDSSMMATDYLPYHPRIGDSWSVGEAYTFGEPCDIVEMPVSWLLDDFPHFEYLPGSAMTLSPASVVEAVWREEYDFAAASHQDGVFVLTMHPGTIGRGHRLAMLERLIEHFAESRRSTFRTLGNAAQLWRDRVGLDASAPVPQQDAI